jgi:SHS2 domain-containing protein
MAGFKFLEHTSDVYIEAIGSTMEEAFIQGTYAIFETMTDLGTIEAKELREIEISAEDLNALLFEWISELLYIFDIDELIFSKFELKIETVKSGYRLIGKCWGEKFDPSKHPPRTEIKAATYSLMEIILEPSTVTIRFVVDI